MFYAEKQEKEYPKKIVLRCYHTEGWKERPLCENCVKIQALYDRKYEELQGR